MAVLQETNELIIGDHNWWEHCEDPVVDGQHKARGLVPRNMRTHPVGFYPRERALNIPLVPEGEMASRVSEAIAAKAQLSDIRNRGNNGQRIPSRDQNGRGYCWMHSGTGALILIRARMHQPYADLSAYGPACKIKNFRDEGGWGAQGLDWLMEKGCPTSATWPQQATSRTYDTDQTWQEALKYRVTEGWIDTASPQYDRNLTFMQVLSLLIACEPVITDFNWWSHSVCAMDAVNGTSMRKLTRDTQTGKLPNLKRFEFIWGIDTPTMGWGVRILNSWGDSWSEGGTGVLTGSKAIPDGATCPRVAMAA